MTTNNHPAHGSVSLERLHQIRETLSKAAAQSDGGNLGYAMADAVKVIDEVLNAEPVAYMTYKGYLLHAADPKLAEYSDPTPLYDAPPAPAVPDTLPCPVHLEPGLKFGKGVRTQCMLDALRRRADYYAELEAMTPEQRAEHDAGIAEFKAMLGNTHGKSDDEIGSWNNHVNTPTIQAGNSPLKWGLRDGIEAIRNSGIHVDVDKIQSECEAGNHTEQRIDMVDHFVGTNKKAKDGTFIDEGTIPVTQIKPVADLYGITSPTGSETSFTFDAVEARGFIGGGWTVQEYVELERYQKAVAGNSPVTPDGWIPVSERMPKEIGRYWCYVEEQNSLGKSHYQWNCSWNGERWWVESDNGGRVTHWMELPAAPQQEHPKSDVIGSYQGADGKDHPIVTFSSPQQEVKREINS